ncbi:MAG: Coenzyme F420 hydrogenase/dehydrogenase, beta subunit C-terminal domain, partial [bacterium]|nr:Coenzyme F420 hydrogenase/dehydrogenase, beta subunit C-terminal domain [bacterium]
QGDGVGGTWYWNRYPGARFTKSYLQMWEDESGWDVETRCKLCPDALGEAADVAAADVWPGGSPTGEDAGFNGIIVRTATGEDLVTSAVEAGNLVLGDPITPREFDGLQPHQVRKKKEYTRPEVNALANFSFLTAESNWKIGADDPAEYLAGCEDKHPGVLRSQWIPEDRSLWSLDRYPEFLKVRRTLLAAAANELLGTLRAGRSSPDSRVAGSPGISQEIPERSDDPQSVGDEDDADIAAVLALAARLRIAAPDAHYEICDDETGEVLAVADIAWPQGIQPGRAQPVALLLEPDPVAEEHLGERGYRFFTSKKKLVWHLEEVLGFDIDGDRIVGEVDPGADTP